MRKIIYAQMVSLDGFMEGPGGDLGWSEPGEELHKHFNDMYLTGEIDTSIYGRRLYENMAKYWPTADSNPTAADVEIEFSRAWKQIPKMVYSTTLERVEWNSRLFREINPEGIRELKNQPGNNMDIGGATLASAFMKHDLIDEYRLYIHPVFLGGGKPMFPPDIQQNLRFTGSQNFECKVVMLRYEPRADHEKSKF